MTHTFKIPPCCDLSGAVRGKCDIMSDIDERFFSILFQRKNKFLPRESPTGVGGKGQTPPENQAHPEPQRGGAFFFSIRRGACISNRRGSSISSIECWGGIPQTTYFPIEGKSSGERRAKLCLKKIYKNPLSFGGAGLRRTPRRTLAQKFLLRTSERVRFYIKFFYGPVEQRTTIKELSCNKSI